uniref:RING-type domain-containing protein n=1 Tax=Cyprinus carpio TaxID=7962 RepID=A0A8C2E5D5_CYPCA
MISGKEKGKVWLSCPVFVSLYACSKMAEARFPQNEFTKDPVTIQCGHSYCMSCITGCWNEEDEKGVYSCPQCTQNFSTRPALFKNVVSSLRFTATLIRNVYVCFE